MGDSTLMGASLGCRVAWFHFQVPERSLILLEAWFPHLNEEVEFHPSSEILGFRCN